MSCSFEDAMDNGYRRYAAIGVNATPTFPAGRYPNGPRPALRRVRTISNRWVNESVHKNSPEPLP
jgi:hypothetical protein